MHRKTIMVLSYLAWGINGSHTGSHQDDKSPADSCNQVFSGFTIKSSHCSPICASISSSSVSYWCSCQEDPSLRVSVRFNQLRFVRIHLIAQTLHVLKVMAMMSQQAYKCYCCSCRLLCNPPPPSLLFPCSFVL